jgi:hypothetical protein
MPLETEWEVHHRRVLFEALRVAGTRELKRCEQSCRALRHVLRQQEDLRTYEREMRELDNAKDQIMTLLKVGLANLGIVSPSRWQAVGTDSRATAEWMPERAFGDEHGVNPTLLMPSREKASLPVLCPRGLAGRPPCVLQAVSYAVRCHLRAMAVVRQARHRAV